MAPSVQTVPQMARRKWLTYLVLQAIFSERYSGRVGIVQHHFVSGLVGHVPCELLETAWKPLSSAPDSQTFLGWFLVLETLHPFLIRDVTSPLIYFNCRESLTSL